MVVKKDLVEQGDTTLGIWKSLEHIRREDYRAGERTSLDFIRLLSTGKPCQAFSTAPP
jgi:hypothetical protein